MTRGAIIGITAGVIAVPILGYSFYRRAINAYGFKIKKGTIQKLDLKSQQISLRLTVQLSSKIGLNFTLTGLNLQFFVNDVLVATAAQTNNIVIPANGSVDLMIDVNIDGAKIKTNIVKFITDAISSKTLILDVKGDTKLRMLGLPLDFNAPVQDRYVLSV